MAEVINRADVGIIGGGVAGLTVAYRLAGRGIRSVVFEREDRLGGLASSFDFGGLRVERYYHFICGPDTELIGLARELGIGDKIQWRATRTAYFYNNRIHPFSSPLDLLRFSPVSFFSRIRFGIHVWWSRYIKSWEGLDRLGAKEWLVRSIGEDAFNVIWYPLIGIKFGDYYDKISAAWIWHRIYRVANSRRSALSREKMGFIEGGSETLIQGLADQVRERGSEILLNTRVEGLVVEDGKVKGLRAGGRSFEFGKVISAVPLPVLIELLPEGFEGYKARLEEIKFLAVLCMVLRLKHPVSENFWLNVNDPGISFNGIIEYTNLNDMLTEGGEAVAYIPFYLSSDSERFSLSDQQIFSEYLAALSRINPHINEESVIDYRVFRDLYAQPICPAGFKDQVPAFQTPIQGLYLIDSSQLYPSDRTVSGSISLANTLENLSGAVEPTVHGESRNGL